MLWCGAFLYTKPRKRAVSTPNNSPMIMTNVCVVKTLLNNSNGVGGFFCMVLFSM